MENIKLFFEKLDRKKAQYVSFNDATLGGQNVGYIWYRLRYFFAKSVLNIAVHCIEFYLLFVIFNYQIALSILVFRILGFIASGTWWGALETMREQIRQYSQQKLKIDMTRLKQSWMRYAYYFMLCVSIIFIGLFFWKLSLTGFSSPLFYCYALAIFIEINIRIMVLTLHSSCFATNRVYRPFYSIISPPIVGLCALGILWNFLGGYALVLAGLVQSGLSLYWTYFFTKKMIQHKRLMTHNKNIMPTFKFNFSTLKSATSSLFMDGSGLLILIILHDHISFYLLAPIMAVCFNWSKLFYFDNIKYQASWLKLLLNKLNKSAHYASFLIALFLTVITYIILASITPLNSPTILLGLFAFFVTRALLGIKQIILFTQKNYKTIIFYNIILFCYIIAIACFHFSFNQLLYLISAGQLLLFIFFSLKKSSHSTPIYSLYMPYFPWLESIKTTQTIYALEFSNNSTQNEMNTIIRKFIAKLNTQIQCTRYNLDTIYIACNKLNLAEEKKWLAIHSNGLIIDFKEITNLKNVNMARVSKEDLIAQFKNEFQNGIYIDLTINLKPTSQNWNHIAEGLNQYMNLPLQLTKSNRMYISALYRNHAIDTLFLIPKTNHNATETLRWQKLLLTHVTQKTL